MKTIVLLTGANGNLAQKIIKRLDGKKQITLVRITSKNEKKKDFFHVNFQQPSNIRNVFLSIKKKIGEPDVLINNAAINTQKNFQDFINNSTDSYIYNTYQINSFATLLFIKYFLKTSANCKNKKVINLLNRSSIWGNTRHVDYYSSKAAIYNASRSLANDYKNVSFFNFLPGPIGLKKFQCDPEIIINQIYKCCVNDFKNNYYDFYFDSYFAFLQRISKDVYNYISKSKLVLTKKIK